MTSFSAQTTPVHPPFITGDKGCWHQTAPSGLQQQEAMPEAKIERLISDARAVSFEKRGNGPIAKHYVYTVRVQWSDGSKLIIHRRYDDFFNMHAELLKKFPLEAGVISKKERVLPELPKKIYIGRSQVRKVAEKRLAALDQYLQAIGKLDDKITTSPPVLSFFEARQEDLKRPMTDGSDSGGTDAPMAGQFSQISGPMRLEHYRAIGDYKKQNRQQVDLKKDKEYEVIQKDTSGWWLVKSDQAQGWAPASFLEPVDHKAEDDYLPKSKNERVVTLKDYKSTGEFDDELSFPKHAVMKVIYKTLDGWWYVRYNEQNGYVPAAYLTALREDSTWADDKDEAGEEKEAPSSGSGAVRQKFFGAPPRRETLLNVKIQKRHTTTQISADALRKAMLLAAGKDPSVEIVEEEKIDLQAIEEEEEEEEEEESEEDSEGDDDDRGEEVESEPYRAAADYEAESEEEVSFKAGDMVDVVKMEDNGWWLVVVNEQAEGWAPATFLEPLNIGGKEDLSGEGCCNEEDDDQEDYVSVRGYVGQDDEELTFPEGVVIKVLHKYMEGWWYASYDGKKGYVCASALEPLQSPPQSATIDVPSLALRPPSIRHKMLPSRTSIINKDSLFSALQRQKQKGQSKLISDAIEEEADGEVSPPRRSPATLPRLPRSRSGSAVSANTLERRLPRSRSGSANTLERRMPKMPARPTVEQLERCTIQVRGALKTPSQGVVRPTVIRPSGMNSGRRSASPHQMEQFKPVSTDSDASDEVSSSEVSPGIKRRSQNLSPQYLPGQPPALPPSRSVRIPLENNIDPSTCILIQQPGCVVSPSSSKFRASPSPRSSPTPTSPRKIPPSLPQSRQASYQRGPPPVPQSRPLDVPKAPEGEMRGRSKSTGHKLPTQYSEVYYV